MCWDCGCKIYDDAMGSEHTLTTARLNELAKAAGKEPAVFLNELHEGLHRGELVGVSPDRLEHSAKDMGHSLESAQKELHDSLHVHGQKHLDE
jgi:hypothetical protein